jgi:putative flippase GtrA
MLKKFFLFFYAYFKQNQGQIGKYLVVGVTAAIIDFGLLYALTDGVHIYYLLSATISFIVAAIYNYSLNRAWTFRSSGSRTKQVPIFFIVAILGVLLNNTIMYLGVEKVGLYYLLAKVFAAAVVTIWNFFGNKYLTFRLK